MRALVSPAHYDNNKALTRMHSLAAALARMRLKAPSSGSAARLSPPARVSASPLPLFRGAQLQYVYYNFVTELDPVTGLAPDVLMLLDTGTTDATSTADIYCNPQWVTVEGKGSPAQPGDAQFYTGALGH